MQALTRKLYENVNSYRFDDAANTVDRLLKSAETVSIKIREINEKIAEDIRQNTTNLKSA